MKKRESKRPRDILAAGYLYQSVILMQVIKLEHVS